MAWNKPGNSDNSSSPPPRRPGGGRNPLEGLMAPLRGLFDGGNPLRWVLVLLGLWLVFSSFVLVSAQERGVVLRLGKFNRIMASGPNFKLPWPLEQVTKVNATRIETWDTTVPVLTRDENIVNVEINVQYRVGDPRLYLFGTRDAKVVLQQAALSTVREQLGRASLDTVLGSRQALRVSAREQLQRSLDAYRTGLEVTDLNLQNARPPDEVKPAFDDVNSAQQDKDRVISEARAYAAKVVPEARGQAASIRTVAEGYKTAKIARATGDAERFSLLVEEYRLAPEVTRKRLWLETVQEVLAGNRKVVGGDGRQLIYVPMTAGESSLAAPAANAAAAPVVIPAEAAPASPPSPRSGREPRGN